MGADQYARATTGPAVSAPTTIHARHRNASGARCRTRLARPVITAASPTQKSATLT